MALDQGGLMVSLYMKKTGLYVGSQSGARICDEDIARIIE